MSPLDSETPPWARIVSTTCIRSGFTPPLMVVVVVVVVVLFNPAKGMGSIGTRHVLELK